MELNEKQKRLLDEMKKLPYESEELPAERENSVICAILIGTQEDMLDEFIEIAKKSDNFQDAFNEMFKNFPVLEPIDDDELEDDEK